MARWTPFEAFALNAELVADAGAGAEEDGVVLAVEHLVDGDVLADVGVAAELDAERFEVGDVVVDDLLAHLEVGDAVDENAAGLGPVLEDRRSVALIGQELGDGKPGGTGADDGHLASAGGMRVLGPWVAAHFAALEVGDEGLELADGDSGFGAAIDADGEPDHAGALAEALLGAEAAAHLGEVAGLAELVGGAEDVAFLNEGEGPGNVVTDGAGFLAGSGGALDAALGLDLGGVEVEAEVRLVPVAHAVLSLLLGDRLNGDI